MPRADGGSDLRFAEYGPGYPYRKVLDSPAHDAFNEWLERLASELGARNA